MSNDLEVLLQGMTPAEAEEITTRIKDKMESLAENTIREYRTEQEDARQAELTAEYKKVMRANQGNRLALQRIKQEYRAKGVKVDQVDFS